MASDLLIDWSIYTASAILQVWHRTLLWRRTTQKARVKTRCCHMGYSFRFAARVIFISDRQDSTYYGLCYTGPGALFFHGESVRSWCDGSSNRSFMVDPLRYFSFQPGLHDWCVKKRPCYVPPCMRNGAYKRTLAAVRKDKHM